MTTRALFVGLGGSGGVSLAHTKAKLTARLRETGWSGSFPDNVWRFVHIDVPYSSDISGRLSDAEAGSALALGVKPFGDGEYAGLIERAGTTYNSVDTKLMAAHRAHPEALYGWRPKDPVGVNVPIDSGAGGLRGVGAVIAAAERQRIQAILSGAYGSLVSSTAQSEVARLCEALGDDAQGEPQVFIVSSMIGGAGAGLFMEVSAQARYLFDKEVTAYLLTPDAFDDRLAEAGASNALALISEIQSAGSNEYSAPGWFDIGSKRFPNPGSLPGGPLTAKVIFTVGGTNGEVTLSGKGAAERVVGEMLASTVTSKQIFDTINAYAVVNTPAAGQGNSIPDQSGLTGSGVFRSVGYARLELGRRRFGRYTFDRLLALTGSTLQSSVLSMHDEDETQEMAIERYAQGLRITVAEQVGLHELDGDGQDNDQILDRLRPALSDAVRPSEASRDIGSHEELDLVTAQQRLAGWHKERMRQERAKWATILDENLDAWGSEVQSALIAAARDIVGKHGLPVAARTFELIASDLLEASDQLRAQSERARPDLRGLVGKAVPAGYVGMLTRDMVDGLCSAVCHFMHNEFESNIRHASGEAARLVSHDLVVPLSQALANAARTITGSGLEWETALEVLPRASDKKSASPYLPKQHEIVIETIEGASGFADRFEEQIMRATETDRYVAGQRSAVSRIVDSERSSWLRINGDWRPGAVGTLVHRTAERLVVELDTSIVAMSQSVDRWIEEDAETLRTYLGVELKEFVENDPIAQDQFVQAFSLLVGRGKPLGETNATLGAFHPGSGFSWSISAVPFAKDSDVFGLMEDALTAAQINPNVLVPSLGRAEEISVVSFDGPYQAMCFETLMRPIRTAWNRVVQGQTRRRDLSPDSGTPLAMAGKARLAMPLSMSGPFGANELVALVLGLALAKANGSLTIPTKVRRDRRVNDLEAVATLKDPKSGRDLRFPGTSFPVTASHRRYRSWSGQIIDDAKIAYMQASLSEVPPSALEPYLVLLRSGKDLIDNFDQVADDLGDDALEDVGSMLKSWFEHSRDCKSPNLDAQDASTDLVELRPIYKQANLLFLTQMSESEGGGDDI